MKYTFKFSLFGKKVQMFSEGTSEMKIELNIYKKIF